MKVSCSWTDGYGHRVFGHFVKWDGDYAVTRTTVGRFKCRVYKSNITFEAG